MKEIILRDDNALFEMAIRIKRPLPGMDDPAYMSMFRNVTQAHINTMLAIASTPGASAYYIEAIGLATASTRNYVVGKQEKKT